MCPDDEHSRQPHRHYNQPGISRSMLVTKSKDAASSSPFTARKLLCMKLAPSVSATMPLDGAYRHNPYG